MLGIVLSRFRYRTRLDVAVYRKLPELALGSDWAGFLCPKEADHRCSKQVHDMEETGVRADEQVNSCH